MMPLTLTNVLALFTGSILIALVFIIYLRSQQGDQRVINLTRQALLPGLCMITLLLGGIFANHQSSRVCSGSLDILRYAGLFAALLLVTLGGIRFLLSANRDQQLISQPVLLAVIIAIIILMIEYFNGCV